MSVLERVLILSVSAGSGHMQAATAIKSAILEANPQTEITVLDTFRYTSPFLDKMVFGTYLEILKVTPVVYGYLYHLADKGQPLSGIAKEEFNRILNKLTAPRLVHFLKQYQPQVVICTHPFPLGIMDRLKEQNLFNGPVAAVITDFTVHPFWVFSRINCYFVATEELRNHFIDYDMDIERVHATGIPINPSFTRPVDREGVRADLSISNARPVALITGGGLGMGPLADIVKILGNTHFPCQLIVITGSNENLRLKLERIAPALKNPSRILGFVNNIHELMSIADFMVGKAGGLTCAEALAKGLPMFVLNPIPGQEVRNARFLSNAGAAVHVDTIEDLQRKIEECLREPGHLLNMATAAKRLGRPFAARTIVKQLEKYVTEGADHSQRNYQKRLNKPSQPPPTGGIKIC